MAMWQDETEDSEKEMEIGKPDLKINGTWKWGNAVLALRPTLAAAAAATQTCQESNV